MEPIAQTNVQLYNQLWAENRTPDEMLLVRRTYELATRIYSGSYQANGKPFVCHLVGVASLLALAGCPAPVVAAGLLHNVYGNGDFGDGREYVLTRARRRVVREGAGELVESLLARFFSEFRSRDVDLASIDVERLDQTARALVLIEIADLIEHTVDLGVLYFGDSRWVLEELSQKQDMMIGMAEALGCPELADACRRLLARIAVTDARIPAELRPPDAAKYLKQILPKSARSRTQVRLLHAIRRAWLPLRQRLRALTATGQS